MKSRRIIINYTTKIVGCYKKKQPSETVKLFEGGRKSLKVS